MQRRITVNGTVYSVFKGTFARVVRRTPKGRPAGWEVRITDCGIVTKKIFALTDLRTANDYARTAENERLFSQGATIRDADRAAVNEYRRWEQSVRETGRPVPSLLELVIDARRNYERRAAAATWEAARDAYVAEKSNAWTPTRKSQIERFFARFTAALPNPAALLDDISAETVTAAVTAAILTQTASNTSQRYYTTMLAAVWERAVDKKLAAINTPRECLRALQTAAPRDEVTFLPVDAARAFLRAAAAMPRTPAVFSLVLALLTGIRESERLRLQWRDFRLTEPEPYINLPHGKAKTRQHRAVYLHGNHATILQHFFPARRKADDLIMPPASAINRLHRTAKAIAAAAGLQLPRNVLRHTAATYLCAHLRSYGAAAMILGNSEAILKRHYAGLVTHAAAEQFFSLEIKDFA